MGTTELVAVAKCRDLALDDFAPGSPGEAPVVLAVERPASALRLGGLIRTAHAFGAAAVVISGSGVDHYDPQCVRASAGALFALPVFRVPGIAALRGLRDRQAERGIPTQVVGIVDAEAAVSGAVPVDAHALTTATIVVIGDAADLGANWPGACDAVVRVPAAGTLPAPCTAAIALYEIFRQRGALQEAD
nr:TrmH family RNA methyltransferase [Nocardia transvalensis]